MALLYVMFSCVFVTFPYVILGQMWYLILSIPDLCQLVSVSLSSMLCFLEVDDSGIYWSY